MTSGGNRKPAHADAGGDKDGQREDLIDQACRQPATARCNSAVQLAVDV
jgi:hypothetical protein